MRAVFAIPGDRHRRTGRFRYESAVLDAMRGLGHAVDYLRLPDAFPDPSPDEVAATEATLRAVPADVPLILDGFVPAWVGATVLARVAAPLVLVIHHPQGFETGLATDRTASHALRGRGAAPRGPDRRAEPLHRRHPRPRPRRPDPGLGRGRSDRARG